MKTVGFIGNKRVLEQLDALIISGRLPHALLLEGDEGIGKRTLAKELALRLVCRGEEKPCAECPQCKKVMQGVHPDVTIYEPEKKSGVFKVDTIRRIIDDAYVKPNEADYKIYILTQAHCMNASAQNALLKMLEEPPSYVLFILTATSKSMLLSTVLSRCVTLSLEGVDTEEGARLICEKNSDIDFMSAKKTVELFGGNIGKALESLNDTKTSELITACNNICKALVDESEFSLLCCCNVFQKDRQGIVFACDTLKDIFRDALFSMGNVDSISAQQESVRLVRSRLSRESLVRLIDVCEQLKREALMNANNTLLITRICYKLREAVGR